MKIYVCFFDPETIYSDLRARRVPEALARRVACIIEDRRQDAKTMKDLIYSAAGPKYKTVVKRVLRERQRELDELSSGASSQTEDPHLFVDVLHVLVDLSTEEGNPNSPTQYR